MVSRISKSRFEALKRQAKRLKRSTPGASHAEALDLIARGEGFANWSLLARAVEETGAPVGLLKPAEIDKKYSMTLTGMVDGHIDFPSHVFHEQVAMLHPAKHYARAPWIPPNRTFVGREKATVAERIATARRVIEFIDVTGLRPSTAWTRIFGREPLRNAFDHSTVWRDDDGRYIVATEPYAGRVEDVFLWCNDNGWRAQRLGNRIGIWNPCRASCPDDCGGHTRMILTSPPSGGTDLDLTWGRLLRAAPGPHQALIRSGAVANA